MIRVSSFAIWLSEKLKFDYLKNENSFRNKTKNIFPCFTSALFQTQKASQPKCSGHNLSGEIWYLNQLKYAEFDGDFHFFCFSQKQPFWADSFQNTTIGWFKLKFGMQINMITPNSMVLRLRPNPTSWIRWWCSKPKNTFTKKIW